MEFFGMTLYGPQNYIKDLMREYYKEPQFKRDVKPLMEKVQGYSTLPKKIQRPDCDVIRVIDMYIGRVDGFAYGSMQRFIKMKRKGVIKPAGPCDMYRLPLVTSIEVIGAHLTTGVGRAGTYSLLIVDDLYNFTRIEGKGSNWHKDTLGGRTSAWTVTKEYYAQDEYRLITSGVLRVLVFAGEDEDVKNVCGFLLYGWWQHDPELAKSNWYTTDPRYPQPASPNTLILDKVRKNNKYASLF